MYKNAGKSIKNIVKVVVGIQIALFIILGIILMLLVPDGAGFLAGALVAGVGCFFAWLSGLILYAYGDMADNMRVLAKSYSVNAAADKHNIEVFEFNSENRNLSKFQRSMIKEYRAQLENGVLTQEEYKNKVENILQEN